jgi:hypothetical protein
MANLLLHKERSLHSLAISAAPCGHCRQFYSELACAVRSVGGTPYSKFSCRGTQLCSRLQASCGHLLLMHQAPSGSRPAAAHVAANRQGDERSCRISMQALLAGPPCNCSTADWSSAADVAALSIPGSSILRSSPSSWIHNKVLLEVMGGPQMVHHVHACITSPAAFVTTAGMLHSCCCGRLLMVLQDRVRFVFGYRGHASPEVFSLDQLLPARCALHIW